MNNSTRKILKEAAEAVERAKEEIRNKRNEEDRKYILAALSKDLMILLEPFLDQIARNSRITREEFKAILQEIKVEAPNVNVEQPRIEVSTPEVRVPEIKVPTIKVPPIRVPDIKVPTPKVTVKTPKQMEVKGLAGIVKTISGLFKKPIDVVWAGINRDNPVPVILTDEKGIHYRAVGGGGVVSSGGGGPRMITIRAIEGNRSNGGGTKTVAAAGTPEQLTTTDTPVKRVWIQALDTNTDAIVVGGKDVDETSASRKGIALFATQGQWLNINNLNKVYVDVAVGGEGVHYYYEI